MKTNKGFSLVELIIVIAIIGILASISSFAWQRHVDNTNLRTAANDVISDFQNCKIKATSENRNYQISFITGTNSSYTISAPATDTHAAVSITKLPTAHGAGIKITSATYSANIITFQARGIGTSGTIVMANSRASNATITTNITGRAYVTFTMQ
ncbi:MAG: GspH/FimT family pseudopilin [Smithella sp.]